MQGEEGIDQWGSAAENEFCWNAWQLSIRFPSTAQWRVRDESFVFLFDSSLHSSLLGYGSIAMNRSIE